MNQNIAQLNAAADWNGNKGAELFRQSGKVKNNALASTLLTDAARHFRTHDRLRRQAFLLSRRKKH